MEAHKVSVHDVRVIESHEFALLLNRGGSRDCLCFLQNFKQVNCCVDHGGLQHHRCVSNLGQCSLQFYRALGPWILAKKLACKSSEVKAKSNKRPL